ncbi:MAG: hypothetical protein MHM6MM_008698, partial [Cercozoa sp. M6MM]
MKLAKEYTTAQPTKHDVADDVPPLIDEYVESIRPTEAIAFTDGSVREHPGAAALIISPSEITGVPLIDRERHWLLRQIDSQKGSVPDTVEIIAIGLVLEHALECWGPPSEEKIKKQKSELWQQSEAYARLQCRQELTQALQELEQRLTQSPLPQLRKLCREQQVSSIGTPSSLRQRLIALQHRQAASAVVTRAAQTRYEEKLRLFNAECAKLKQRARPRLNIFTDSSAAIRLFNKETPAKSSVSERV